MDSPKTAIIIPCYNEETVLEGTLEKLLETVNMLICDKVISEYSFIYTVNDGSTDKTFEIIKNFHDKYPDKIKGINLSRNFGNQAAIIAGITEAGKYSPDCYITIDADLQQDETKIREFIEKFRNGADIVLGIRNDRKTDNFFKKNTALLFYKIINIFGIKLEKNHSEYRLISAKIASVLEQYKETNLFLRGIVQNLGFKKDFVYFDVKKRGSGKSKFNTLSLIGLALNGITSFSIVPLRAVTFTGFLMSFISFFMGLFAVYDKYFGTNIVPGWATIVVLIGFLSGIQILCLGIIAEYLGQLFIEVKARPRYIKESELD